MASEVVKKYAESVEKYRKRRIQQIETTLSLNGKLITEIKLIRLTKIHKISQER